MTTYRFKGVSEYAPPRCPVLSPEDAATLVGYCYGRFRLLLESDPGAPWPDRCEAARDLMLALFTCGAPRREMFCVATIYIASVRDWAAADEQEALPLREEVRLLERVTGSLREASWLHFLRQGPADEALALGGAIDRLLSRPAGLLAGVDAELRLDLAICRAALYGTPLDAIDYDGIEFASASVARAILSRDGNEVARLVDAELLALAPRVRRLTEGRRELFLDRTKAFRDYGWGFLFTGVRALAEAFGCRVPPPATDTLVFYL
jgi:hypothetical protein